MAEMKKGPKLVLIGVALAIGLFALRTVGQHYGFGILKSVSVGRASLPDIKDATVADVQPTAYPSTSANNCDQPIRSLNWAWNSQMGLMYANGGPSTTHNSLMEKHGVCLLITRQDDTQQMQNELVACAKDLGKSTECPFGAHFVTIMADGAGQFIAPLNAQLRKICPDCTAEIAGTTGFSRGEDALWGPDSWKRSPRSAMGDGLVSGVIRDGDWDTAQKWLGDNGLRNNPDEHTYDPDAMNWVNAGDYVKAAQMYISGYCEDRKVVKDGKLTGDTKNLCVKGFVSWTPGDVTAAKGKGGLVRVVSTKQYRSQMPSAIIGIRKWDRAHADKVAGMLAAALEGGDQIKAFPEALKRAGDISARVYGEQSGDYWVRYYKGTTESDATGVQVELGGSYADNMNDALTVFGLSPGSNNNFKSTYTTFAKIVTDQYGEMFKNNPIPPYEQVVNTGYLLQAKSLLDNVGSTADQPVYDADSGVSQTVSDRDYHIEFATGSAQLTPEGERVVHQIKDQVAITGLKVVLSGHTDNTGSPTHNVTLSEQRARAVQSALQVIAPSDFPNNRFKVNGYGQSRPVANNDTEGGRARNRRVEVALAE